ncbi:MAG TPA: hypothetical protein VMD98_12845 [Bryocella sp.]|nr:hypothetical protein [Bryocella sp.]
MRRPLLILAALLFSLAPAAAAQESLNYVGCGKYPYQVVPLVDASTGPPGWYERPKTYEVRSRLDAPAIDAHLDPGSTLQKAFGVQPNKEALRSALHNDDARVRYLAAWTLADDGDKGVIPDIFRALEVEKVPRAQAYLACALQELGDARGVSALHQYCEQQSFPLDVRFDVNQFLIELHEAPCISPVVEALKSGWKGPWGWWDIAAVLEKASPEGFAQLRAILLASLEDPASPVRRISGHALAQIHDYAALPELEVELEHESRPQARTQLEEEIKSYQTVQH